MITDNEAYIIGGLSALILVLASDIEPALAMLTGGGITVLVLLSQILVLMYRVKQNKHRRAPSPDDKDESSILHYEDSDSDAMGAIERLGEASERRRAEQRQRGHERTQEDDEDRGHTPVFGDDSNRRKN